MQKGVYHNRNGNIHSEESKENYLEEVKAAEHELKEAREFIKKIYNEDYEHYETKRTGNAYQIKFKKSGESKYKDLTIEFGDNYAKLEDLL